MLLYHGTNTVIKNPEIRISGFAKDFGYGFYYTSLQKQAERWAITKRNPHIVCVYEYNANENLKVRTFPQMSDEWLDFIAACRKGV